MQNRLEVIRKTKLDLAQWITAGIAECANPVTSQCLANYAAAQLQSAALIPVASAREANQSRTVSLLRRELVAARGKNQDCAVVLTRVSNAMLMVLAGSNRSDLTSARLLRHEAAAARQIRALCRG